MAFWYLGASRGEAEGYKFLAPVVEERKKIAGTLSDDVPKDQRPVSQITETSNSVVGYDSMAFGCGSGRGPRDCEIGIQNTSC